MFSLWDKNWYYSLNGYILRGITEAKTEECFAKIKTNVLFFTHSFPINSLKSRWMDGWMILFLMYRRYYMIRTDEAKQCAILLRP